MKVTMLGCGSSTGVPAIGPDWGVCDPTDPRNRRRRASILIECRGKALLIDTSPDMREQLLDAKLRRLDAVIMTHAHADHLHGLDDLRGVNRLMQQAIPLHADAKTLAEFKQRFGYALVPIESGGFFYKRFRGLVTEGNSARVTGDLSVAATEQLVKRPSCRLSANVP